MTGSTGKDVCTCCGEISEKQLAVRLDEVIDEYIGRKGGLIPVLQIAQALYGYLPQTALKRISTRLNIPFSEVAGVVSFYSFFSTVKKGRHMIRVCLGTACYVRGGKAVLDALRKRLGIDVGETTPDGMFSLEVARCFGACALAPTMAIGEEVFKRVRPIRVGEIVDSYYKQAAAAVSGE